ncbi:AraC family transcriptional regulator [Streptomyces sp. NPDC029216]|uniref:helix-turn-helix domain-containing protein n=1 Tax=Streptomyces sp. NPDC029216 TaxID=3154701 RepID=UPI0033CA2170
MRYFSPAPVHRRLGLVCLGVGVQQGALPVVGPRVLDHHVAVVVTRGRGWFGHAGRPPQPVAAPALLWLVPGVEHHYGPDPEGGGWDECFVDFTGGSVSAYTDLGYITPDRPVVPLSGTTGVQHVVDGIVRAARRGGPLLEVEAAADVHGLLVALRYARAEVSRHGEAVVDALARDALLPISVAEHAARLGIPLPELRGAVRRSTGGGVKEYLLGIRLSRAKELLARTDLPVAGIARRVGYEDPAYFSRLFSRRVGVAPVRFRAQQSVRGAGGGASGHGPPGVAEEGPAPRDGGDGEVAAGLRPGGRPPGARAPVRGNAGQGVSR